MAGSAVRSEPTKTIRGLRTAIACRVESQRLRMSITELRKKASNLLGSNLGFVMPGRVPFGHADALAFHRSANERIRSTFLKRQVGEQRLERARIVPVDPFGLEPEAAPFGVERLEIAHFARAAVGLKLVLIDEDQEAIQAMLARMQRGLPDGTFVALPIAHEHEGAICTTLDSRRQRHAHAERQPVSKRSRGGLDARNLSMVRVTPENATGRAELRKLGFRKESFSRQGDVIGKTAVALAENETV